MLCNARACCAACCASSRTAGRQAYAALAAAQYVFAQPARNSFNLLTHPFALGFLSLPARLGNVDWRMAASLAAGTAVGSLAGSNVAVAAPPGALEAAFCVGMLFLGRKTLATAR